MTSPTSSCISHVFPVPLLLKCALELADRYLDARVLIESREPLAVSPFQATAPGKAIIITRCVVGMQSKIDVNVDVTGDYTMTRATK